MASTSRRRRDWGLRITLVIGVLLAVGGGVAIWAIRTDDSLTTIGPSMVPTLERREVIEVDEEAFAESPPELNDIVAAQGPEGLEFEACAQQPTRRSPCARSESGYSTIRVVKRVVGLPGDEIAFAPDGRTIRNGTPAREPFIRSCSGECGLPEPITVPEGFVFLVGDNRPVSSDSRFWGPIPFGSLDGLLILEGD